MKSHGKKETSAALGDRRTTAQALLDLDEFSVTPELQAWAAKEDIPDPQAYVEEFKDYWRSVGARRANGAVICDWPATFRNRLRYLKRAQKLRKASVWESV